MIASAHITISDLNDPIQQGTAPASPVEGMLWLDTSVEPPQLRHWDGLVWGTVNDPSSLSVGGRNLLLNSTKNFPRPYRIATTDFPTKQANVEVEEWGCTDAFRITGTQVGDSMIVAIFNYESHGMSVPSRTIIGQQYTNSIYIKNNHAEKTIAVRPNAVGAPATNVLPGQAIRWHYSFTATTSGFHQIQIYVKAYGDDFDITYWHPQIEFGNVVSDWSLAPEEVDASIQQVQSNLDNMQIGWRNLLLNSTKNFPRTYQGSTMTKTRDVTVAEWACTDAMRISGTSGTTPFFALFSSSSHGLALYGDNAYLTKAGQEYTYSIYLKNNHATNPMRVRMNSIGSGNVIVGPGEILRWYDTGVGDGTSAIQISMSTPAAGDE